MRRSDLVRGDSGAMSTEQDAVDVIVVCRPEDLATEFLSVLDDDPQRPVHAVFAAEGISVPLPTGGAERRLAALKPLVTATAGQTGDRNQMASLMAPFLRQAATVWTHCPADERRDRARVGWLTALVCAGLPVLHAFGVSSHYQIVSELTVPLSVDQVKVKLAFLNEHAAALLDDRTPRRVPTEAIAACERFLRLDAEEANRMHALLHSVEIDASLAVDPWGFHQYGYEQERIRGTAEWVGRHVVPGSGRLIEVGSCEGTLTNLLLNAGHLVLACEPNGRFRSRLLDVVDARAEVTAEPLENLLREPLRTAVAYLLIEMLYCVEELTILDDVPAELLFLAVNAEELRDRVEPWLAGGRTWEAVERVELVAPRVDFVCGDRVYRRKQGSVGILCRRRGRHGVGTSA